MGALISLKVKTATKAELHAAVVISSALVVVLLTGHVPVLLVEA